MLMSSNVLSHLDYGNSILVNLPKSTTKSLQSIKIMLPGWCVKKQKYDSLTEYLFKLHWLPVHYRCIYKLLTIMYKTLDEQELQYLFDKPIFKPSKLITRQSSSNNKQLVVTLIEKEHRVTEVLVLQYQVIGTNYQII